MDQPYKPSLHRPVYRGGDLTESSERKRTEPL